VEEESLGGPVKSKVSNYSILLILTIVYHKIQIFIVKIAYKNQNGRVRIGEESLGVLFKRIFTLKSNRMSL
jgi:hypothetical protein